MASSCITPDFDGLNLGGFGGDGSAPHCTDGRQNGGETGLDCGGPDCDGCAVDEPCRRDRDCESNSCGGGKCREPTCEDLKVNQDETAADCGGTACEARCDVGLSCERTKDCMSPPAESSATARCLDKRCVLACPPRTGDCNESAFDGCEEATEQSVTHCGACFQSCDLPHVSRSLCVSGMCQVDVTSENLGCDPGYADCDGLADNGCEARLESDLKNCGACNQACSLENGQASCRDGECTIECKQGFVDCNRDARSDGCEVDTTSSVNNCGGCGADDAKFICRPEQPGWSPFCIDEKCGSINCAETNPGNGACDGDKVCDDPLDTEQNCGACGQLCVVTGGTPVCRGDECAIGSCLADRADCDGIYMTGCEVDTTLDKAHCGGCTEQDPRPGEGVDCTELEAEESLHVLTAACSASGCVVTSCEPGYGDCDSRAQNGCEIDITADDEHCGGCTPDDATAGAGEDCSLRFTNARGSCSAGSCVFEECNDSFADCSGDEGCETDLRSTTSCGDCEVVCGGDQQHVGEAPPACQAGTCEVACESGFCPDLSDPEHPCTLVRGVSVSNCEACGETCTGSSPFCDPNLGCQQLFPIQVVGSVNVRTSQNAALSSSWTLTSATTARGRAAFVAIAAPRSITSVRLGGTDMVRAAANGATGDSAYSAIYYLLGSALGEPGTKTLTITTSPSGWGGIIATPIELINVEQRAPRWTETALAGNNPCSAAGGTLRVRALADQDYAGSFVLGAMSVRGDRSATGAPIGFAATFSGNELSQHGQGWTGYLTTMNASDIQIGWNVQGSACWDVGTASVVLRPVIEDGTSN